MTEHHTWIGTRWTKLKRFFSSSDVWIFLLILIGITGYWFVNAISNANQIRIKVPIHYTGSLHAIQFDGELPAELEVSIESEVRDYLNGKKIAAVPIDIDLTTYTLEHNGTINIGHDLLLSYLNSNYPDRKIASFSPEFLVAHYTKLSQKRVPVRIEGEIQADDGYIIRHPIYSEPREVDIFGSEDSVIRIMEAVVHVTETIPLTESLQQRCSIHMHRTGITTIPEEVTVIADVEPLVERQYTIPVSIRNTQHGASVHCTPSAVTVKAQVAESMSNKVDTSIVRAILNCSSFYLLGQKAPLRVEYDSTVVRRASIEPDSVSYIIFK